jgi:hypothetical protein
MFNIIETSVSPGGTVHWEGSGFTPNDTLTIVGCYQSILGTVCDDPVYDSTGSGSFSGSDQIPTDAPPGTYTVQLTDGHGKTGSDSFTVQ